TRSAHRASQVAPARTCRGLEAIGCGSGSKPQRVREKHSLSAYFDFNKGTIFVGAGPCACPAGGPPISGLVNVNRPHKIEPLDFGLVLWWIAATAFGWFAIMVGSGAGCAVFLTPALAALMGGLQRRVLQRAGYSIEANWTVRTALGWLAGLIVLFTVL